MKNVLKSSLSIFLAITIILSSAYVGISELDLNGLFEVKANAASSGTCGENLTWSLDDEGTLTISGTGDMYQYYDATPPYLYNGTITDVIIEDGVTSISDCAFARCYALTSIKIPDSVTSIGDSAFYYCENLIAITIPDNVTSIGSLSFHNTAYYNDSSNWVDGVLYIGNYLIKAQNTITGNYVIKDGTKSIASYAFSDCTGLTSVTIPQSLIGVSIGSFDDCENIKDVYISDVGAWCNIDFKISHDDWDRSYSSNPMYYADNLYLNGQLITDLVIPDGVTKIPAYAFYECDSIVSVKIPDSVTNIGYDAFYGCKNINDVYITDVGAWCEIEYFWEESHVDGTIYNYTSNPLYYAENLYLDDELITDLVIPDGVTCIPAYTFYECENFVSVRIPDSIKSIGLRAFYGCENINKLFLSDIASWCEVEFDYYDSNMGEYSYSANPFYYADLLYLNNELVTDLVVPNDVTNISEYTFYSCTSLTSVTIPDSVTSIGEDAFYGCTNLASVTIPDSITSIGDEAFGGCDNLESVNITDLVAWFNIDFKDSCSNPLYYAENLYINGELATDIVIPDGVTSIGDALSGCKSITSVTIPDSVTSIGEYAFENCGNLVSIALPHSLTSIGNYAFYNCESLVSIIIPDSVTSIGSYAFGNCENLMSIEIPDGVIEICYGTFKGCTSLTSVALGKGIKSIGSYAFSDCESLVSITIPEGVTVIGKEAFNGCSSLASVTIPASLTDIDWYAFAWCNNLKSVYITDIKAWCNIYFEDTANPLIYAENLYINGELVTDIVIPDGITSLDAYTFNSFDGVASITIPASVTSISDNAFYCCENLKAINVSSDNKTYSSVDGVLFNKKQTTLVKYPEGKEDSVYAIPDSVTIFKDNALYSADFETVVLGAGISNIKSNTFSQCRVLKNVVLPTNIKTISSSAFSGCYDIEDVFYEGTEAQWNSVTIASDNSYLINARVHYNVNRSDWETHYGEPVVTQEPNCYWYGTQKYTCPCGHEKTENIPRLEHNYSSEWTIDRVATCSSDGSKSHHCLNCNDRKDVTVIPATGVHTEGEWYISRYASVYSEGVKYKYCTGCGKTLKTATIKQLKCSKPKLSKIENTADGVKVTWGSVNGADSYRVYRKTSKSDWKYLGSTSKTGYTDKTAKSGTKYYYAVRARNEAGNSSLSSSLSKLYLADPTLKTPKSTKSGVALEWNKISGSDGYMVYRKTGSGSYKKIATVKGYKKVKYTDKSAKKGKTYTYKVKAYKSKTYSAYSNAKKIKDKY